MKITYDPEANAVQIVLRSDRPFEDSIDLEAGVTADLDGDGHVIGLEILDARERLGPDPLAHVTIERFQGPSTHARARRLEAHS
jgi:uncharacterized protein YuzE